MMVMMVMMMMMAMTMMMLRRMVLIAMVLIHIWRNIMNAGPHVNSYLETPSTHGNQNL